MLLAPSVERDFVGWQFRRNPAITKFFYEVLLIFDFQQALDETVFVPLTLSTRRIRCFGAALAVFVQFFTPRKPIQARSP